MSRIRRWRTMAARTTAIPLLVRGVVWFAGALAMVVGFPALVFAHPASLLLLGLAILPALGPRTPVVTLVALLPVVGWLVATTLYEEPLTLWRLIPLAWALYLLHSAAALAAHLPYDAIVSPGVLLRWFSRTGLVLAATAVVALYALVAGEQLRGRATLIATVVGIAIAAGVAALLARQLRRR